LESAPVANGVEEAALKALPRTCEVVIVGAGFSGLCAAIRLDQSSIKDFIVLEREAGLGGVWHQNTYPGAACDVASALYSFSFENDYDWPRTHGSWRDIVTYMAKCVDKYAVGDRFLFDTDVQHLEWQPAGEGWLVKTNRGNVRAKYVISACGLFRKPTIPATPGLANFAGPVMHSAMWDHSFDPTGRSIAVVGNGCSAAQIVPAIVDQADHIYLVMRSPVHVIAKAERTYSEDERDLYRRFPILRALDRRSFIDKSLALADLPVSEPARARMNPVILESMARLVSNREKRQAVLPDYPVMAKRPIRSDDYLTALDRTDVDIIRSMIDHVTPDSMVMADGRVFPVDALIFATGFEASQYLVPLEVVGREGMHLQEQWRNGAHAYFGMLAPHFPNFIMIYGPNTNVVGSILQVIEPQVETAVAMIRQANVSGAVVEVGEELESTYSEEVQKRLSNSVWGLRAATNYFTAASGRIVTQWPGTFLEYQERLAGLDIGSLITRYGAGTANSTDVSMEQRSVS
jgi:cation diffusion facilitator CzcD-associated flavoprotein CzcO